LRAFITNHLVYLSKFKKDKKSKDVSSGVLPEEATHLGDAADKKI